MTTNATISELYQALTLTNENHGYSLEFNRIEQKTGKTVLFTLKTKSRVKGSRLSHSGRNLAKASWHAHGNFFESLFVINPNAKVKSLGKEITKDSGNWIDYNCGSFYSPVMASSLSIE